MTENKDKIVTIIGGSGFIGRYIVRRLAKAGYRVRVAVRRPDLSNYMQPSGGVGQIFPVQANVRHEASLKSAINGADIVINLSSINDESGKQSFELVNVDGAEKIAKLAKSLGVSKLIHFSMLNLADADQDSDKYDLFSSKAVGEAKVKAAFPEATIVKPSLVFGPEDRLFNIIAHFAKLKPIFAPILSELDKHSEPVHVDDVAKAVTKLIDAQYNGQTFELGGPQKLSMKEIAEQALHATDREDKRIMQVPSFLGNLFASVCTMLPYSWITRGEIRIYNQDHLISEAAKKEGRTFEALGIKPVASSESIMQYLQHFRPKGDYGIHDLEKEKEA